MLDYSRCGIKGSPTKVKKTYTPVNTKDGVILKGLEAEESADKLAEIMHEAKLV
jgi:hypothetical protein